MKWTSYKVLRSDQLPCSGTVEGFAVLARNDPTRVIRVMGSPEAARNPMGDKIEITLRETQLREAMVAFGVRVLLVSLVISLVRPIRQVTSNMIAFRQAPEAATIISPGTGRGEIGEAQLELAAMQTELRASLKQKTRLAGLGEAVAKINHDLRNILRLYASVPWNSEKLRNWNQNGVGSS